MAGKGVENADLDDSAPDASKKTTRVFFINGVEFTVDRRYYPVAVLGEGAYGTVCLAKDLKRKKKKVAIKKLAFTGNKYKAMALRGLREIHILRYLDHPNLLLLEDLMPPKSRENFDCLYAVIPSMDTNLSRIIRSTQSLENVDLQILMYQMIKGMAYFHGMGLLHRDIKPSNILVNADLSLKICDFGLARGMLEDLESQEAFTEYVVTRHYRAPEVMACPTKYDSAIDVWGVGCVLAELLNRKVLFPGKNYLSQLELILQKIGTPSAEDLELVHKNAKRYIEGLGHLQGMDWKKEFPAADPLALDLLQKMLLFNPHKRISMKEALKHPWFDSMYKDAYFKELKVLSEDKAPKAPVNFDWEKPTLTKDNLIDLMLEATYQFRPELKNTFPLTESEAKDGTKDSSSSSASTATSSSSTQAPQSGRQRAEWGGCSCGGRSSCCGCSRVSEEKRDSRQNKKASKPQR
eukprot:gb/GEZN01007039.1/.p1 GENE.gb/GEZN01007039.1/~~gb/GEZN01007039.1/.p1  ORF type:complete len:474 (-),score=86.69 gb/GEZN01007039.1/:166-1557(-)